MILLAVAFVCLGSIITIVLQFYLIYKFFLRLPIAEAPSVPNVVTCQLPEELLKYIEGGEWKDRKESCIAINLILQFLFREWKDTKVMRRWFMKKISREFLDLQRTTTGKLLERVAIRDLQLGNNLPIIKDVTVNDISLHKERKTIEELDMAIVLEYDGGFQLAVDVDMVLSRTAFLSVRIAKLKGRARLQMTRNPFTHWSISFYEEPFIDFAVESQFQGRPLSQITSLIITQIRRMLRKKHTLPHYKMRFRPFFPLPEPPVYPVLLPSDETEILSDGTFEITVIGCTRLLKADSSCQLYCTLALDSSAWIDLVQSRGKSWILLDLEIRIKHNQQLGITCKQEFVVGKYDYCLVVDTITPNSSADKAGIKKNDIIVSVGGIKVSDMKHAMKLLKQIEERFIITVERQSMLKVSRSQEAFNREAVLEEELLKDSGLEDVTLHTSVIDDYVNITLQDGSSQQSPKKKPILTENTLGPKESPKRRVSIGSIVQELKVAERRNSEGEESEHLNLVDDNTKVDILEPLNNSKESADDPVELSEEIQNADFKKSTCVKASQDPVWNEKFVFDLTNQHNFLNVGVWSRCPSSSPFLKSSKGPKDNFLGHISIPLLPILEECSTNTQGYHIQIFRLQSPESHLNARQWKKWAVHSGFDYRLCYGDIILTFLHKPKQRIFESPKTKKKNFVGKKIPDLTKKSQEKLINKKPTNTEITNKKLAEMVWSESAPESDDEIIGIDPTINKKSGAHEFISTHFHSATVCHFCRKKIWLKVAFQCQSCAMICHKKCISRCQSQTSCPPEKAKFYLIETQDAKILPGYHECRSSSDLEIMDREDKVELNSTASTNSPNRIPVSVSDTPSSSPGARRKKLQGLIANLANAGRSKNTMTRTGSAHNLAPPSESLCPASKSLPPSPQHSPAQSRKSSLQTSTFPWWDPATLEEQDLNSIIEQLLALPHDEVVLLAAKERGKELYSSLILEERKSKLNTMIAKLQEAIDSEAENRMELIREEHDAENSTQKAKVAFLISKSDERTQALAVLMLHYLSGLQHCFDQEETQNLNSLLKPEQCDLNDVPILDHSSTSTIPIVNISEVEDSKDNENSVDNMHHLLETVINDDQLRLSYIVNTETVDTVVNEVEVQENGWSNDNNEVESYPVLSNSQSDTPKIFHKWERSDGKCISEETSV